MKQRMCVIIGFCYDTKGDESLMSSSIDMFTAFTFFSSRGFRCKVMSDVTHHPYAVLESMSNGIVKDEIYSFLPSLPLGRKPLKGLEWISVRNMLDFTEAIKKIDTSDVNKLSIYYTGHCETNGMIVTPDDNTISSSLVMKKLLKKCERDVEVISIYDACFVGNCGFPFSFEGNRFVLKNMKDLMEYCVVHFSSSLSNEASESHHIQSVFTSSFFNHLSSGILSIRSLLERVQRDMNSKARKRQTASCSSSFDVMPILYSWLLPSGLDISIQ